MRMLMRISTMCLAVALTGGCASTGGGSGLSDKELAAAQAAIDSLNVERRAALKSYEFDKTTLSEVQAAFQGPTPKGLLGILSLCRESKEGKTTTALVIGIYDDEGQGMAQYPNLGRFSEISRLYFREGTLVDLPFLERPKCAQ